MLLVPTDMPNKLKQTRQTNLTSVGILRNSSNSGSVNKQKKKTGITLLITHYILCFYISLQHIQTITSVAKLIGV